MAVSTRNRRATTKKVQSTVRPKRSPLYLTSLPSSQERKIQQRISKSKLWMTQKRTCLLPRPRSSLPKWAPQLTMIIWKRSSSVRMSQLHRETKIKKLNPPWTYKRPLGRRTKTTRSDLSYRNKYTYKNIERFTFAEFK